jgi:hypothetical protein
MYRIVTLCGIMAASLSASGCVPTGMVPSVGQQIAAAEAAGVTDVGSVMAGIPGNQAQCERSAAILANPLSTPGQREAAKMAADANNC